MKIQPILKIKKSLIKTIVKDYFSTCLNLIKQTIHPNVETTSIEFSIANYGIQLFFLGKNLTPKLSEAFCHLSSNKKITKSALTIYVVDEEYVQFSLPFTPWYSEMQSNSNDIWISDNKEIKILHQPNKNILMMLDLSFNEAIYWVKSADQIPYYDSSAPLRPILHWWLSANGAQLLHAAAIGVKEKGILLVGKGGSGKSNTAIAALDSELVYVADDYCLLTFEPTPKVHSLFSTGKLFYKDIERYEFLKKLNAVHLEREKKEDKALFFLYPTFKEKLTESLPINAIFIPKVTNQDTVKITPISSSKAYLALAPSTIFQLQGAKQQTHENILKLVNQVPCFSMELSNDAKENNRAISSFLEDYKVN